METGGAVRVVEAVANRENEVPEDLPPLYEVINPDCLEDLFRPVEGDTPRDEGHVDFPYCGYWVTYHAEGVVELKSNGNTTFH